MMTHEYQLTPQKPIPSGFGWHTTATEVLHGRDLSGKVAIVTGGYSGIGLETTRVLSTAGAHVIVPARSPEKARAAISGLTRVEVQEMELIDPDSIDRFAQGFLTSGRQLDILINNAGTMAPPLVRDARGYESQFATNHLGHFQLTARLWPALVTAGRARVVSLSSSGIAFGGVDFDDPNFDHREYEKWQAYGQSKSANSLFAVALDRFGFSRGVRAFAVHPGGILTNLARFMTDAELEAAKSETVQLKTVEQGAATSLWCATSDQLAGKGGVYCMDCDIAPIITDFSPVLGETLTGVLPHAIDPELAQRLWRLSEQLTGVRMSERRRR
jgi:NAD(P)-dependent dehydrogenase (short-subunit alcohol dehydrogenase family)